ncbi:MAG TPA: hypothetical protein VM534_05135 [Thermoanaerobaculia bacterium]|nr:hypothetical protein [Thermoanaerobaculia bacterium]
MPNILPRCILTVLFIGFLVPLAAEEPVLLVQGTMKWYDQTAAPNVTFQIVPVDQKGAEIITMKGDQPLPPIAEGKTAADGKFKVKVPKNRFGSVTMRFGVKLPGNPPRYVRVKDGTVAVLEAGIDQDALDLDKLDKILFAKKP